MSGPVKRSVTVAGHRTSLSMEPEFWSALQEIAARQRRSLADLITEIDKSRDGRNLSSAARVFVLKTLKS